MNRVLPASRREEILAMVNSRGSVRVSEVAEALSLAPITIRRDIARLHEEGLLEQVRGGARRLSGGSTAAPIRRSAVTIGLVTPSLDFYWPRIISGVNSVADAAGAHVQLQGSTFAARDNLVEIQRMSTDASIDGLMLVPDLEGPDSAELVAFLETLTKPTVLIERVLKPHGDVTRSFASVSTDHRTGGTIAVQHLAGLGHRRIGLLTDKPIPSRHLIADGWSSALAELGLDEGSPRADTSALRDEDRLAGIQRFVDECVAGGATAVIVHSDEAALVVVDLLTRAGLSIPADISVIAYDDELAGLARPALTAVRPPKAELGASAMRLLLDLINEPQRPIMSVEICPSLVVRGSTAEVAGR